MPPYWVLVIITFFACNAQTFMETGAMVTSIRNFDTERYCFHSSAKPQLSLPETLFARILSYMLARQSLRAVCLVAD